MWKSEGNNCYQGVVAEKTRAVVAQKELKSVHSDLNKGENPDGSQKLNIDAVKVDLEYQQIDQQKLIIDS